MNMYKFLGAAWLVMIIAILCGYSPSKLEVFCSYAVATCAIFAKGFEGDSQ
ncbi:hypothetical protein [Lysinibacillus sphaericus]|uniref:hypothetical protein n=1 Tax=Lysinibacillus sphaericus TaxID=1421 RepID=UPI000AA43722|nr:hypothetical protein [Lysinibacillus sphaericus]